MRWYIKTEEGKIKAIKRQTTVKLWFDSRRTPVWLTAAARARVDRVNRERKKESNLDTGERNLGEELYNWNPLSCAEY